MLKVFCPCCGNPFDSNIKFKNHVFKTDEFSHNLLQYIYENCNVKVKDLAEQRQIYWTAFESGTFEQGIQIVNDKFKLIQEELRLKKEQEKEEKRLQKEAERQERIRQQDLEAERIRSERKILEQAENRRFKAMPEEDRPGFLLRSFYSAISGSCYNYPAETKLIKGLYTKYELTADQIRDVLKYMQLMGKRDLRSVNYMVADALFFSERVHQINAKGTVPYLINKFYRGKGVGLNAKKFLYEINALERSIHDRGITMEQAENIVDVLIVKPNSLLTWFDSTAVRILQSKQKKNDPCIKYTEEKEIQESIKYIVSGQLKLNDVNPKIKDKCIQILTDMLTKGEFNQNYNYSEFAFKVCIPVNEVLIKFIKTNDIKRNSFFITNKDNPKIQNLYKEYVNWKSTYRI